MRPQTPAELFAAYVKGTLVNLTQRKFKKTCKDISRILEVAMQDSNKEEHARAAPPSSWQAGTHRPCAAPTFSSSPKSIEQWQPDVRLAVEEHQATNWVPVAIPGQQLHGTIWSQHDKPDAASNSGSNEVPQQQQQYIKQQASMSAAISGAHHVLTTNLDTGAVIASAVGCGHDLTDISLPHISGLSSLMEASQASGQQSPRDLDTPTLSLSCVGEK